MAKLVLAMNMLTKAVTQYTQYPLEGACVDHEGQPWGATTSGIFKLEEPEHDEAAIPAWFRLPVTDLDNPNQKRLRSILVAGESENDLELEIAVDEDPARTRTVIIDKTDLSQAGAKTYGRRDQKGRHFQLEIANKSGADFSVDAIDVLPVILATKPGRR